MNKSITLLSLLSLAAIATNSIAIQQKSITDTNGTTYDISQLVSHQLSFNKSGHPLINKTLIFNMVSSDSLEHFALSGFQAKQVTFKSANSEYVEISYISPNDNKQKTFWVNTMLKISNGTGAHPLTDQKPQFLDIDTSEVCAK